MKLTVKYSGQRFTFSSLDAEMTLADFKAVVAAQLGLESTVVLKLGPSILVGPVDATLAQVGLVTGDLIFVEGEGVANKQQPANTETSSSLSVTDTSSSFQWSSPPAASNSSSSASTTVASIEMEDNGQVVEEFGAFCALHEVKLCEDKIALLCHYLLTQKGFALESDQHALPANWKEKLTDGRLKLTYAHPKSFRHPELLIDVYDYNTKSSCLDIRGSCVNVVNERIFVEGSQIRPQQFKENDQLNIAELLKILPPSLIDPLSVLAIGYESALLNALTNPCTGLLILSLCQPKTICRLERTCNAAKQLCSKDDLWKSILKRDFGESVVSSVQASNESYREAYKRMYVAAHAPAPLLMHEPLHLPEPDFPFVHPLRQPGPGFPVRGPQPFWGDPDINPFHQPGFGVPDPFPHLGPRGRGGPRGPRHDLRPRFPGYGPRFPDFI